MIDESQEKSIEYLRKKRKFHEIKIFERHQLEARRLSNLRTTYKTINKNNAFPFLKSYDNKGKFVNFTSFKALPNIMTTCAYKGPTLVSNRDTSASNSQTRS